MRFQELKDELTLCKIDRDYNLKSALRLYQNSGNSRLIETQDLLDQISRLRSEIHSRDSEILSRDQTIEGLNFDLSLWASQDQWLRMQSHFYDLQQEYGQMPQIVRDLEQKYDDLEDGYIGVVDKLDKVEADYTELKVEHQQTLEERQSFEDDARKLKRDLEEAQRRLWALEVQREHTLEQKAKSDRKGKSHEQKMAAFATTGADKQESSNGLDARPQHEVAAAAEKKILGQPQLGYTDISLTFKE